MEDIHLLFRKFAADFAEKYSMPAINLSAEARRILENYKWPGNIRQLKNVSEQISVIEETRTISEDTLKMYLHDYTEAKLPALYKGVDEQTFSSEREILYKVLFDMKNDMNDLKKLVYDLMQNRTTEFQESDKAVLLKRLYHTSPENIHDLSHASINHVVETSSKNKHSVVDTEEFIEESLSLEDKEIELIKKALEKHKGKRKNAANELGISERTLYRKLKEHDLE